MDVAKDLDSGGDFSVYSFSDARSKTGSSGFSRGSRHTQSTTHTRLPDFDSMSDALRAGGPSHRSMYAKLAEEALLGSSLPNDPEGAFEHRCEQQERIDATEYFEGRWRMGFGGSFWRVDTSPKDGSPLMQARCCVAVGPDDPSSRDRTRCGWILLGLLLMVGLVVGSATIAYLILLHSESKCCQDDNAVCLACQTGTSVEEFCATEGAMVGAAGCKGIGCCTHRVARCLACDLGISVEAFCENSTHINVPGCGTGTCGSMESGFEYLGGDLYSMGSVTKPDRCCALCQQEEKCTSWSWAGSRCFLKQQAELIIINSYGFVSGLPHRDAAEFNIKNRFGDCLQMLGSSFEPTLDLARCSAHSFGQRWLFQRKRGRISTRDGEKCLEGQFVDGAEIVVRNCDDRQMGQQWEFNSTSGFLKPFHSTLCADYDHETKSLALQECFRARSGQLWSFWNSDLVDRESSRLAMAVEARSTTTTTTTRSRTATTTTATRTVTTTATKTVTSTSITTTTTVVVPVTTRTVTVTDTSTLTTTTTTKTLTSTTTTITWTSTPPPPSSSRLTTTTTPSSTLFCFCVMVSWNYEPNLVQAQVNIGKGIFQCDGYAVYSDKVINFGPMASRVVAGTDLKATLGGVWNTLLNTPVFIKVWDQVLADGQWELYDWIVKVDCDAVFFPTRLRSLLTGGKLENATLGRGVFLNNCRFGLHGPIEVVSNRALQTYQLGYASCPQPPQEDVYLQACLRSLAVMEVDEFSLLAEDHCKSVDWQTCQSAHVAFHPFKEIDDYKACLQRAELTGLVLP